MDIFSIVITIICVMIAIMLPLTFAPIMVWWERRVAGFIQDRPGPNRCHIKGFRLGGFVQSFADMLKLVFKEDFTSNHIKHQSLYNIAPAITFVCAVLTFAVIPFADTLEVNGKSYMMQGIPTSLGILWVLAFTGLSIFGTMIAGYASNNKYALLGAIRSAAQVISYEISMGLAIVSMLVLYGTIDLNGMVQYQSNELLFGVIPKWGIILQPIAAIIFIVTAFAETNRAPFDLVEAESELVAGFHTEYGAMRFGLFFVGEYVAMTVSSALIVTMFLGGYNLPFLNTEILTNNINIVAIATIISILIITFLFTRWIMKNNTWPDENDPRAKEAGVLFRVFWALAIIVSITLIIFIFLHESFGTSIFVAVFQLIVFITKLLLINFVFIVVRWTLPRFRYDQLQHLGWKILLPLAIINILITATVVVMGA